MINNLIFRFEGGDTISHVKDLKDLKDIKGVIITWDTQITICV